MIATQEDRAGVAFAECEQQIEDACTVWAAIDIIAEEHNLVVRRRGNLSEQ